MDLLIRGSSSAISSEGEIMERIHQRVYTGFTFLPITLENPLSPDFSDEYDSDFFDFDCDFTIVDFSLLFRPEVKSRF